MTDRSAPADPREDGPAAQRLEAFLESLPRSHAKTQALIDFGTVLRDANDALRLAARQDEPSPALRAQIEALRVELVERLGMQYGDGRKPDLTLLVIEAVEAALAANPPQTREEGAAPEHDTDIDGNHWGVCPGCRAEATARTPEAQRDIPEPPDHLPSDPDPDAVEVRPGTWLHWGLYLRGASPARAREVTCDHRDAYGSTVILGENPAMAPVCLVCNQRFPKWPLLED